MITDLQLTNFQSHQKTKLKLCPGVNAIVGPSDSGKSAIIRALRYLMLNEQPDVNFVYQGQKSAEVAAKLSDGTRLARRRTPSKQELELDGEEFGAVGRAYPQIAIDAINMDALNFQPQLEPHYLFMSTPGEIARELNSIVDMEKVDLVLSTASSRVRERMARAKAAQEAEDAALARVEDWAWADDLDDLADQLENLLPSASMQRDQVESQQESIAACIEATEKLDAIAVPPPELVQEFNDAVEAAKVAQIAYRALEDTLSALEAADTRLSKLPSESALSQAAAWANGIEAREESADERGAACDDLDDMINRLVSAEADIDLLPSSTTIDDADRLMTELESLHDAAATIEESIDPLAELLETIHMIDARIKAGTKIVEELESQLPSTCPTCGAPL